MEVPAFSLALLLLLQHYSNTHACARAHTHTHTHTQQLLFAPGWLLFCLIHAQPSGALQLLAVLESAATDLGSSACSSVTAEALCQVEKQLLCL